MEEKINGSIIYDLAMGAHITQCLYVVSSLNIADILHENGKLSANELAAKTQTQAAPLFRVLVALVDKELFTEEERPKDQQKQSTFGEGQQYTSSLLDNILFGLTKRGESLLSNGAYSVKQVCLMMGSPGFFDATGKMLNTVQTGKPGYSMVHGTDMYSHFDANSPTGPVYHACMEQLCALGDSALLFSYDFSQFSRVVDVGGGSGALLARILKRHQNVQGVLFESESALSKAPEKIQSILGSQPSPIINCAEFSASLKKDENGDLVWPASEYRCTLVSGDFMKELPSGGNCYILKNILMDLTFETGAILLKQIGQHLPANARVLITQAHVPVGESKPHMGRTNDLVSLATTDGVGVALMGTNELNQLLSQAGLRLDRTVNCLADQTIFEVVRQ